MVSKCRDAYLTMLQSNIGGLQFPKIRNNPKSVTPRFISVFFFFASLKKDQLNSSQPYYYLLLYNMMLLSKIFFSCRACSGQNYIFCMLNTTILAQ